MKKRLIAGTMSVLLMATCFAGCGDNKEEVTNSDGNSFTYWVEMPALSATAMSNLSELTMYKEMEKITGMKVEFIHPQTGQASEKFNLMMASKEFPDVIEYNWAKYQGGAQKALKDGVAVKLNDYLEEYAPNFSKILAEHDDVRRDAATMDGDFYGFPRISSGSNTVVGGLFVREDWLNDLGLQPPETIEEWETMLRRFRDEKGATAPLTLQAGYFITASECPHFMTAFGMNEGYYVDDNGKVCFGPAQDEYKDYLALMNRWFEEGLLDKEFATINGNASQARIIEGKSGAGYGFVGSSIGGYLDAWKARGETENSLIGVSLPVLNKGDVPQFGPTSKIVAAPQAVITTKAKNVEKIVSWLDYFYSQEGNRLMGYGIEGLTYNIVDGKLQYTDMIINNSENLSTYEALARHCRPSGGAPTGFFEAEGFRNEIMKQEYPYESQIKSIENWSAHADIARKHRLPELGYDIEVNDEMASLKLDINSYTEEMIMRFIQGDEPIENFGKFQQTLKEMRLDRYLQLQQEAYDKYLAR